MAKKVVWTFPARNDLLSHLEYLARESRRAASELFERTDAAAKSLADFPERGRTVPELSSAELREVLLGKYRMIYRVGEDEVVIVRLIHGRQDFFAAWKNS